MSRQCKLAAARRQVHGYVAVAVIMLILAVPAASVAATIVVNDLTDPAANRGCSLRDAINNANTNRDTTNGRCAAGNGADTITFAVRNIPSSGIVALFSVALTSALPEIMDPAGLTIDGGGNSGLRVVLLGAAGAAVLTVHTGAHLTVRNLIIQHGPGFVVEQGDGVVNNGGDVAVMNSIFAVNGRHISISGGTTNVTDSLFTRVTGGAGIRNEGGLLNISDSSFFGPGAGPNTPLVNVGSSSTLNIRDSSISHNITNNGASSGVSNRGGTVNLVNTTIANNLAHELSVGGAGLTNFEGGTVSITNSTIVGNGNSSPMDISIEAAGGITNRDGTVRLKNTIIAGNTAPPPGHSNCSGMILDEGNNISNDDTCQFRDGNSVQNVDIEIDQFRGVPVVQTNGGRTASVALLSTSFAIDRIPSGECTDQADRPNLITMDQRGFVRPAAKEQNGIPLCDTGAFEFNAMPLGNDRIVNDLLKLDESRLSSGPLEPEHPSDISAWAPGGIFLVSAPFSNMSSSDICTPSFIVTELSGTNQLFEVQVFTPPGGSDLMTIQGLGGAAINHQPLLFGAGKDLVFVFAIIVRQSGRFTFKVSMVGTVQPPGMSCQ